MNVLKLEKIVVNTSFGRMSTSQPEFVKKILPAIKQELSALTGQASQSRAARLSIAGFKLREGMIVGLKTTLRGQRMRDFLSRTVNVALPRIRDFHGLSLRNVDQSGNLTFGIKEHTVFPEISLEDSQVNFGLQVTFVLEQPAPREEAIAFYRSLGVPLRKEEDSRKSKKRVTV